jgi:hypothetical protein
VSEERDEAMKMIGVLKEELKLQEQHFAQTTGSQADYYTKLVDKSVQDEKMITDLMAKISKEKSELQQYRSEYSKGVQNASDIGTEQVQIL